MTNLIRRPSGLVVQEPKPEPPKPRQYFTATIRRHDDFMSALAGIQRRGGELVSVARHGEGGAILGGMGYVVVYLHHEKVDFEEKC